MIHPELSPLSDYSTLNNPDKMKAILSGILQPVSKQLAIELSGIEYEQLSDEEKNKVDAVFADQYVSTSDHDGVLRYVMFGHGRHEIEKKVHMPSVHAQISEALMKGLGLDI